MNKLFSQLSFNERLSTARDAITAIKGKYSALESVYVYGAVDEAPQNLVCRIIYTSDQLLRSASLLGETDEIAKECQGLLVENGWPREAFSQPFQGRTVLCSFASQELAGNMQRNHYHVG